MQRKSSGGGAHRHLGSGTGTGGARPRSRGATGAAAAGAGAVGRVTTHSHGQNDGGGGGEMLGAGSENAATRVIRNSGADASANSGVEDWASRSRAMVAELKDRHRRHRMQVELDTETNPINSNYSNNLVSAMQKEEVLFAQDSVEAATSLEKRVDGMLRKETFAHFRRQAQQNAKRWMALAGSQDRERQDLRKQILEQADQLCRQSKARPAVQSADLTHSLSAQRAQERSAPRKRRNEVTEADLVKEEERLNRQYHENWAEYQNVHLDSAFALQRQRIMVEWGTYTEKLQEDYLQQRSQVARKFGVDDAQARAGLRNSTDAPGTTRTAFVDALVDGQVEHSATMPGATSPASPGGATGRWQDKEKQSRLIHTAPVLAPTGGGLGNTAGSAPSPHRFGAGGNPVRTGRQAAFEAELQNLNTMYKHARHQAARQQADAVRWMRRQHLRMQAQIDAAADEKKLVLKNLLAREDSDMWNLDVTINLVLETMRSALREDRQPSARSTGSSNNEQNSSHTDTSSAPADAMCAHPSTASASAAPVAATSLPQRLNREFGVADDGEDTESDGGGGGGGGGGKPTAP